MAQTYEQLQKRIETLQREAEAIRRKEVAGVVARIKEAITAYGLTAADLGLSAGAAAPARGRKPRVASAPKAAAKRPAGKVAIKYRDGDGNTWTGRGLQPRWLKAALAAGKKLEDFKV